MRTAKCSRALNRMPTQNTQMKTQTSYFLRECTLDRVSRSSCWTLFTAGILHVVSCTIAQITCQHADLGNRVALIDGFACSALQQWLLKLLPFYKPSLTEGIWAKVNIPYMRKFDC